MRVKWNLSGFRAIRNDAGVARWIDGAGQRVATAAGDGHTSETTTGGTRARATVRTSTIEARRANADPLNQPLARAIDAA